MTNHRLPKEFGKKFVAALRSGDYTQGRHGLYTETGYCCLGVAAHICGVPNELLIGRGFVNSKDSAMYGRGSTKVLSDEATQKGYPEELLADKVGGGSFANTLASLNDDGNSFGTIASWIEQNVLFYE